MTIATTLLEKLRDINKAIERGDTTVIPPMVLDAEDCVLQMERELMASLVETERLRRPA
jgi:ribosomal protein L18E